MPNIGYESPQLSRAQAGNDEREKHQSKATRVVAQCC